MTSHLQRQDCSFCRYYDAQHDATRCHCASCWRRRDRVAHQPPPPPSSSPADPSSVAAAATAVSPSTRLRASPQTAGGASTRCEHGAVPFHHCRLCVLDPYFHHAPAQWDGHAVVCAPRYARRDGCGCSLRCECRRRRETGEHARRPQYAMHELPVMGARAALYSKP